MAHVKKTSAGEETSNITRKAAELSRRSRDLLEQVEQTHADFEKVEQTAKRLHAAVRRTRAKNRRILRQAGKKSQ